MNGAEGEAFYQKRAPSDRPSWLRTVTLSFPSGRTAEEVVVDDAAGLAWIVNLGCIELHPHPVRSGDLDHPDELRIDLDPGPGVSLGRCPARRAGSEGAARRDRSSRLAEDERLARHARHRAHRAALEFTEVRRAALALSREVERRLPALASSKWWKEERHGVFLDYNQNAKDRTTCSAYSVRPLPDARVSAPLHWHEVSDCDPADFTVFTMPKRFAEIGDPHADMDAAQGRSNSYWSLRLGTKLRVLAMRRGRRISARRKARRRACAPSRAKSAAKKPQDAADEDAAAGDRKFSSEEAALAGLERWKKQTSRSGRTSRCG